MRYHQMRHRRRVREIEKRKAGARNASGITGLIFVAFIVIAFGFADGDLGGGVMFFIIFWAGAALLEFKDCFRGKGWYRKG